MNLFAPFNSDCYKLGHADMYAKGTTEVYSNLTPRTDRIHKANATKYYDGKLVFVGAQGAIMEIVENWDKFFAMDKSIALARFKLLCDNVLGPDVVGIDNLSKLHDLGYLPLEIKTLDEGSKVPFNIPVLTIKNTVDHAYWLVNFLETTISNLTWKPSTVATIASEYKAMVKDYAIRTGTPMEATAFQIHSFACRGMSGPEDSARSEFGHICSHMGTDSLGSIMYAQEYYGAGDFVAASVPATEHAVATSNILRIEEELGEGDYFFVTEEQQDIYSNMWAADEDPRLIAEIMFLYELMQRFPTGTLSYVTDSFDFWGVLTNGLPYLKEVIMRRESNGITPGKLVIRPDSGDPVQVVCGEKVHKLKFEVTSEEYWEDVTASIGYEYVQELDDGDEVTFLVEDVDGNILSVSGYAYQEYDNTMHFRYQDVIEHTMSAEEKGAVETLYDVFGGTVTETGHKLLDEHIGLIYGDSITPKRALAILEGLDSKCFASGNIVFGVGSYTYQHITRDTFGFAVKATSTVVNGKRISIFKAPKTDIKKHSSKGLLQVVRGGDNSDEFILNSDVSEEAEQYDNLLKTRFLNGLFYSLTSLDIIRSKL